MARTVHACRRAWLAECKSGQHHALPLLPGEEAVIHVGGKKGQRVLLSCLASSIDSKAKPMIEVYDASGRKLATNRNYKDTYP